MGYSREDELVGVHAMRSVSSLIPAGLFAWPRDGRNLEAGRYPSNAHLIARGHAAGRMTSYSTCRSPRPMDQIRIQRQCDLLL